MNPPGPFKCTDCGTWWVGWEHRCAQPFTANQPIWSPTVTWMWCYGCQRSHPAGAHDTRVAYHPYPAEGTGT